MGSGFTYMGASGTHYTFALVDTSTAAALPWQGGVLIFANYAPDPIHIAGVPNVYEAMTHSDIWTVAKSAYNATQVYFLPNADAVERQQIVDDLIESYAPPMNDEAGE